MSGLSNKKSKKKIYNIIEKFSEDEEENVDDQAFAADLSEDIQELTEEIEEQEEAEEEMEQEIIEEQEEDQRDMDADEDQNDLEAAEEDALVEEESEAMEDEQDAADEAQDAAEEAEANEIEDAETAEVTEFDDEQAAADAAEEEAQEAIYEEDEKEAAETELSDILEEEKLEAAEQKEQDTEEAAETDLISQETDVFGSTEVTDDLSTDESDDEGLSTDDLTQINTIANPLPEDIDESDDDIYVRPVPKPLPKGQVLNDVDEQLSDLTLADGTDDDNLFDQTGAAGLRAKAAIDKIAALGSGSGGDIDGGGGAGGGGGGGGIAGLILRIPIKIIQMIMNAVLTIVGAALEKPINALDGFLQPIRDALYRLYLLLKDLFMFVDQLLMFPLNIAYMYYEIIRTAFSLFGFPSALPRFQVGFGLLQPFEMQTCIQTMGAELNNLNATCNSEDVQKTLIGPIMIVFMAISNINPFRLSDLFFSKDFRNQILNSIRVMFELIFVVFRYIFVALRIFEKLILLTIDIIGQTIGLVENVVTMDNITEFALVMIYSAIILGSLVGAGKLIAGYSTMKEYLASSGIAAYIGFGAASGEGGEDGEGDGKVSDAKLEREIQEVLEKKGPEIAMKMAEKMKEKLPKFGGNMGEYEKVDAKINFSPDIFKNKESINEITNKLNKIEALEKISNVKK